MNKNMNKRFFAEFLSTLSMRVSCKTKVNPRISPLAKVKRFPLDPNILLRLCGGGSDNNTEDTAVGEVDAEKVELQYDPQAAITEKKSWNIAANVMAVLCVMICVFLHGFFA